MEIEVKDKLLSFFNEGVDNAKIHRFETMLFLAEYGYSYVSALNKDRDDKLTRKINHYIGRRIAERERDYKKILNIKR